MTGTPAVCSVAEPAACPVSGTRVRGCGGGRGVSVVKVKGYMKQFAE